MKNIHTQSSTYYGDLHPTPTALLSTQTRLHTSSELYLRDDARKPKSSYESSLGRGTSPLKEAVADLRRDILDSPRSVRDEHGGGLGRSTDFLHRVEVLSHKNHVHDILSRCPRHVLREGEHAVPQAVYDGLTLTSYTEPRQVLGFGLPLGFLDLQDFLSFGFLSRSNPEPSSCRDNDGLLDHEIKTIQKKQTGDVSICQV